MCSSRHVLTKQFDCTRKLACMVALYYISVSILTQSGQNDNITEHKYGLSERGYSRDGEVCQCIRQVYNEASNLIPTFYLF